MFLKFKIRFNICKKLIFKTFWFFFSFNKDKHEDKKIKLVINPTTKPILEIIPRSDSPMYSVGTKDKKPINDVQVTIKSELLISLIDFSILSFDCFLRFSINLKLICMPKSTSIKSYY